MKSTNQSNKLKSRAVSIVICAILILCALLSFGLSLPNVRRASADEPAAKTVNGIRFVQVAAGKDFAIGLTYDGDLYGWSLIENRGEASRNPIDALTGTVNQAATLGEYYTATPRKIDVVFRRGPGTSSNAINWNTIGSQGSLGYHDDIGKTDRIKKIVATRDTAAFITNNGYVYTWGKDAYVNGNTVSTAENVFMSDVNTTTPHYLLLRTTSVTTDIPCYWYTPYIIDYGYYYSGGTNDPMSIMRPLSDNALSDLDIAAGEYNYIIKGNKNINTSTGSALHTLSYVWGSLLYSTVNTSYEADGYDYIRKTSYSVGAPLEGGVQNRRIVSVTTSDGTSVLNAVAGGYNVGFNRSGAANGSASVQLRGRNFLNTRYEASGFVNTVTAVAGGSGAGTNKIKYSQTVGPEDAPTTVQSDVNGGVIGANVDLPGNSPHYGVDVYGYYGRVSSGSASSALEFVTNSNVSVRNAYYGELGVEGADQDKKLLYSAERFGVSLGNDVGYGINSDGELFAWGDNTFGQLGSAPAAGNYYKQTPVKISVTGASRFVSVAAGKQISGNLKPFHATDSLTFNDSKAVTGFNANAQNAEAFVSGAVDADGRLYVWSSDNPIPTEVVYGNAENPQEQNRFLAVYSGYENNLFAITNIGKLVLIRFDGNDGYTQTYYDKFIDFTKSDSGVITYRDVENWTVDSTNRATFTPKSGAANISDIEYPLGSATFYVWNNTDRNDVIDDDEENEGTNNGSVTFTHAEGNNNNVSGYTPLVSGNAIGDVYRILGVKNGSSFTGDDGKKSKFLTASEADLEAVSSFAPKFSYKTSNNAEPILMTDKQRKNMFDFDVVADSNGIGLQVTPKKSSRGYTIVIDFYIARFSAADNFTGNNGSVTDNAVYYDFKPCQIQFTVNDTVSVRVYNTYDAENGGKSNIPLLDPNNEYNKYYSVAVQNVSAGIPALLKHLNGDTDIDEAVLDNVIVKLNELDNGFPARSKISSGNLTYYLGADAAAKYSDSYQYLFSDRDGDRIVISNPEGSSNLITEYVTAVDGKINTIKVTGVKTGIRLTEGGEQTLTEKLAAMQAALVTDFDNVFGLYNIKLSLDGNEVVVAFDYDVLTVEAKGSTGEISYTGTSVTSYATTQSHDHASANIRTTAYNVTYADTDNGNFAVSGNGRNVSTTNILSIFSTPTLRVGKGMGVGDNIYVGDPSSSNTFTVEYTEPMVVGESVSIDISDYFINRNGRIVFSYNNSTNQYGNFESEFEDQTGYGVGVVKLNGTTLTVTPTITLPIYLTVGMQRFADSANTVPFENPASTEAKRIYDEKIEVNFVFGNKESNAIRDFTFAAAPTNNPSATPQLITRTETFDVLGTASSLNGGHPFVQVTGSGLDEDDLTRLRGRINISGISTTEDGKDNQQKLFTVAKTSNTSFTVTPLSSGTGTIVFVATLYNKPLVFTVTVNIAAKTYVDDLITVVDDKYVYIDAIKTELTKANSSQNVPYIDVAKYAPLYNTDPTGAIYFTETAGAGEDEAVERPSFIREVVFEGLSSMGGSPNIRIKSNNTTDGSSKTYYMHVKFTNVQDAQSYAELPAGSVIEAVYPVTSGKVRIPVEMNIDVRHSQTETIEGITKTVNGSGLDMTVTIRVQDLLNYLGKEQASEYKIIIIRSDEATTQYFTYTDTDSGRAIMLTPVYNTPVDADNNPIPCELEVALTNESQSISVTFYVSVTGILTTLPVMTDESGVIGYGNIWIYSLLIVFGVLAIIFIVRLIVYFRKRAQQRAIIKRNQELIRMRDRMHNKGATATREQVVKTRLKMDDPKYAKMFREMKKARTDENGGLVVDDDLAGVSIEPKSKKKKKKGGKKTVAELKAELEAKKAAFAAAQAQSAQPVNPFVQDVPVDGGAFDAPDTAFVNPDEPFVAPDGGFDGVAPDDFGGAQSIDGSEIIFDATDVGDGE